MDKNKIKTYNPVGFLHKYMKDEENSVNMLKMGFSDFFIVQVEDLIKLMKLPIPPVRSTNHSIIYLTEGEAKITIGSKDYTIYKNELIVVQAGQLFSFKSHDINKGYLFNFNNDFLIGKFCNIELLQEFNYLNIWGNSFFNFNEEKSFFILQLFKRLYYEYYSNGLKNLNILHPYLITLLCEINELNKNEYKSNDASLNIAKEFHKILFKEFKNKHLVTDYSSLLFISPNHLNKCVKKVTGKTPNKWIDETLISEAKVLLHQTELSISDIASELGYYDHSYFSRLFKKYEGISPMQYRNLIEKS